MVIYSGRNWCRLALAGNPTVLLALFGPDEEVVFRNEVGVELVDNAHRFVSKLAAARFLGYLQSQKSAMLGEAPTRTPIGPNSSRCTDTTRSSRCTHFVWAFRESSCFEPGGSTFPSPGADLSPYGRCAVGRSRCPRYSRHWTLPNQRWRRQEPTRTFLMSPIGSGSTTGLTSRTLTTGTHCRKSSTREALLLRISYG